MARCGSPSFLVRWRSWAWLNLVSFIAVLSVNLGLINLFPIPVLDGGHLLFYLAEAFRGRPLPPRAQEYGFRAGLALLVGLFILATWNDLAILGSFTRRPSN